MLMLRTEAERSLLAGYCFIKKCLELDSISVLRDVYCWSEDIHNTCYYQAILHHAYDESNLKGLNT